MNNEKWEIQDNNLYTLMPLVDFKGLMGIDDREDKLATFCLVTSTFTIEQYCKRRFLLKQYHERIEFTNDEYLILNEFPVHKIISIFALFHYGQPEIIEPDFYKIVPYEKSLENIPYMVIFSPAILRLKSLAAYRVIYRSGYRVGDVPDDLQAACMELAAWNLNRYRSKRIGMTGNIKGSVKEGEHFEMSMPENVRTLLEPYRRKTI